MKNKKIEQEYKTRLISSEAVYCLFDGCDLCNGEHNGRKIHRIRIYERVLITALVEKCECGNGKVERECHECNGSGCIEEDCMFCDGYGKLESEESEEHLEMYVTLARIENE